MLVRAYRTYQPALLLGLFVLVPACWSGLFVHAAPVPPGPYMPAYATFAAAFSSWAWTGPATGMLVTLLLAYQLDRLANDRELFVRPNHLPALLLPLLLAAGPLRPAPDAALLGMPAVLHALRLTWGPQGNTRALGRLFDAGCLVGLAALFHFPYAFMVVVVWASSAVMRPYAWRDYLMPLFGLALVLVLAWGAGLLLHGGGWAPMTTLSWRPSGPLQGHVLRDLLAPVLLGLLLLSSLPALARVYQRSIMRVKNVHAAFMAFLFACALLLGFSRVLGHPLPAVLAACPLAVLFTHPLQAARHLWHLEVVVAALAYAAVVGPWWG